MNRRLLVLLAVILLTGGFKQVPISAGQPAGERAAQDQLPQSQDPLWSELAKCHVDFEQKNGLYKIELIPEVKALDGKSIRTSGFVLPLDASDNTRHFLLTKRTPVCLFCPPGEPNEVIEVRSKQSIAWGEEMIVLHGRFHLVNNQEKALFFEIVDAEKD